MELSGIHLPEEVVRHILSYVLFPSYSSISRYLHDLSLSIRSEIISYGTLAIYMTLRMYDHCRYLIGTTIPSIYEIREARSVYVRDGPVDKSLDVILRCQTSGSPQIGYMLETIPMTLMDFRLCMRIAMTYNSGIIPTIQARMR